MILTPSDAVRSSGSCPVRGLSLGLSLRLRSGCGSRAGF